MSKDTTKFLNDDTFVKAINIGDTIISLNEEDIKKLKEGKSGECDINIYSCVISRGVCTALYKQTIHTSVKSEGKNRFTIPFIPDLPFLAPKNISEFVIDIRTNGIPNNLLSVKSNTGSGRY